MAFDPRIALGGVPVNIDPGMTPFEMEAGRQQLMSGRNKLMAYQSGVNKENALSGLIKGATNDQGVTDWSKYSSGAAQQGYASDAIAGHNQARAIEGEADIDQGAKIDKAIKTIEFLGRMGEGVRDEPSLQEWRAKVEEIVPGSSAKLPVTYTPEGVNQVLQQAMTHKEKLEQQKVEYQKSQDLQKQQNFETSQDTTRRGQNMADERFRTPKPVSFLEQTITNDKVDAIAKRKKAELSQIDDTISEYEELKKVQDRTTTGPVIGSEIVAGVRKAVPFNLLGGDDLQELEKGYAKLALKAIGSFKAEGSNLGSLTGSEGDWVKDTQAAINSSGRINQKMLDRGIELLRNRKALLSGAQAEKPPEVPSAADGSDDAEYQNYINGGQ